MSKDTAKSGSDTERRHDFSATESGTHGQYGKYQFPEEIQCSDISVFNRLCDQFGTGSHVVGGSEKLCDHDNCNAGNEPYGESPVSPAIGAYFNKKAYTDPALRKEYTNKGYWVNIRLIRYADVLLMGAESANEKGISGEAIDYLEQVRARARGTNTNILPKVTTTDQGELREAIRHERRVELGLEFDRFYDLVRWGIAKEVLQAAGKNYQNIGT